ncbi:RNA methyltransferase [Phormidium tenue FACHB-886]|nr:RNA methyltransferase [Phormidium tenue FACHB-886]
MVKRTPVARANDRHSELPRFPLVVCASLVQNPANLGGLCRTVEAFRLEGLALADLAIAQTSAFRNLAASAQHWQPLIACPAGAILGWLQQQQQRGYSLVALHLQPDATPLPQFQFARQTVLVLGQELTGIPGEVLQACDRQLIIPQFGTVESLNVQVAGAIAIYEYIRQHGG